MKWRARMLELARQGDADAQAHLAWDLHSNPPVQKRLALHWCRKAARAGIVAAQVWLALSYDQGDGVRRDARKARRWLERAADQGDAQARVNLGVMCARGEGGPRDRQRANRLYRLSAAGGSAVAMRNLGSVHL